MVMLDDLMQHVSKGWYWLYWAVLVVINVMLLSSYILSRQFGGEEIAVNYGLNDAVLYMSLGMLTYLFVFYWLAAKVSWALASFLGAMMIVLQFMNVLNETDQSSSSLIYVIMWLIVSWLVGMFGLTILLGAMLVSLIYLMLTIDFDFSNMEPVS